MSADDTFLLESVFRPVAVRVTAQRDSLLGITRFNRCGIEGWLKVEAARALDCLVEKLQNKGPDLKLTNGHFVELKAATNCDVRGWLSGLRCYPPEQYQQLTLLFLGSDKNISARISHFHPGDRMIGHERFTIGTDEWIIGLVKRHPKPAP